MNKWGLSLFLWVALAAAQPYPQKAVTWIVPFPPGGGTDISARTVAAKLADKWRQSVVIENRAGAAGIVGTDAAAKARPDGYTMLIVNVGITSINPSLYPKLPYDPERAFVPVAIWKISAVRCGEPPWPELANVTLSGFALA